MIDLFPLELEYCNNVAEIAKKCLPESWSLAGIQDVLRYSHNIYYIAKDLDKDEVIGFAGIMIVADEAELLNIAVLEEYRRQGVAQKLLTEMFLRAKSGGAYRMLLEVRKGNLGARQLYDQNHFGIIGERKNYYSNPTEDAIIMEKLL